MPSHGHMESLRPHGRRWYNVCGVLYPYSNASKESDPVPARWLKPKFPCWIVESNSDGPSAIYLAQIPIHCSSNSIACGDMLYGVQQVHCSVTLDLDLAMMMLSGFSRYADSQSLALDRVSAGSPNYHFSFLQTKTPHITYTHHLPSLVR